MTPDEIIQRMTAEGCFSSNGRLTVYPEWLTFEQLVNLEACGKLRREFYRFAYGHENYYLV